MIRPEREDDHAAVCALNGLAGVYAIGLFFGIVFLRSGNVWIPAVMHGIRPQNMTQARRHGRAISGGFRAW